MAISKQQLLIEYLVSSPDTYALCQSIVSPSYFDPEWRKTVEFLHEYYGLYNSVPTIRQIGAETGVDLTAHDVTRDQVEYCSNEIEKFCRLEAIKQAVRSSMKLIQEEDYGTIEQQVRDAISVSLNKDLGIDYFADPAKRLEEQAETAVRIPTGWDALDEQLSGGMARTEIILFSANSGGGKSITLANYAVNMLERGLNVMYITLELAEYLVAQRFDTMFTGVPSVVWQQRKGEIIHKLETIAPNMGQLTIKHFPAGTNSNRIRGYLKEYELKNKVRPDVLIVDYLDIMGTNEYVSADNISEKDKRATEQLREIGFDNNMIVATASQQNRSAIEATELNQSHIAGGMTKVNTVDVWASIILTPAMKAIGQIAFHLLKTRNSDGVGNTVQLGWDAVRLRISSAIQGTSSQRTDKYMLTEQPKLPPPPEPSGFGSFGVFHE